MADTEDADSQLLDKIDGKYGEVGDYDDLVNADEDALLEDDSDGLDIKGYGQDDFYNEDENDTDVLDLEAQDAELDDDLDDKINSNASNLLAVTSTTSNELDDSFSKETSGDEYNRSTDKFKNERVVADSLPEDGVSGFKPNRNNRPFRGRNRGGKFVNQRNNHFQKNRNNNSNTVHINPHFKGQVKINNDARLAWDARHKINQKYQVGRVMPFNNQNNKNMIRPWNNNVAPNNPPFQNIQQAYPPAFQQQQPQQPLPPQQPIWNQYQPNNFNQVQIPNQQVSNQQMFMPSVAPPPQNIFTNQPPTQFNQPLQQLHSVYPNQNMNPIFSNTHFIQQQQPNQYNNIQMEAYVPRFQPNQPPPGFNLGNNFVPPPNTQSVVQFNNAPQQKPFQNTQRFIKPKNNLFNQNKQFNKGSPLKRRLESIVDLKKRKRNVSTGNLHEVKTVETPDTTVQEEKQIEDEDEETRLYRKKIEEQKLLRQKVLAEKEKRRQQAITEENASAVSNPIDLVTTVTQNIAQPRNQNLNQRNLQIVRINPPNRNVPTVSFVQNKFLKNSPGKKIKTVQNSNIRVINTANDESNYDKQHLASFLSNRKIIAKDQSLVDTSIVVVSNLAAGTTDVKLRKLCQGIGDVKKLQMSPKERQATIQFNSVASAHEFFKKYQRSMLDLSMIQVALKPTT